MAYKLRFTFLLSLTLLLIVISVVYVRRALANNDYCVDLVDWYYGGRWRADLFTGRVIQLSPGYSPSGSTPSGYESPNGIYTAYTRWIDDERFYRLEIENAQTGYAIFTQDKVESRLTWSPDSQWLVYVQSLRDTISITAIRPDGSQNYTTSFADASVYFADFAFAPDGRTLAVSQADYTLADRVKVDLLTIPTLELQKSVQLPTQNAYLSWSPSSDRIVVSGSGDELFMYSLADDKSQRLTISKMGVSPYLFWSPNEDYLIAQYSNSDFTNGISIFARDGTRVVDDFLVPGSEPSFRAIDDWLNDHTFLTSVWTDSGIDDLALFDLRTGTRVALIQGVSLWQLSPDHHHIAFMPWYNFNPDSKLLIMPLADLSRVSEIQLTADIFYFDWTNDGSALAAYSRISPAVAPQFDLYSTDGLSTSVPLFGAEIPDSFIQVRRASCGELDSEM